MITISASVFRLQGADIKILRDTFQVPFCIFLHFLALVLQSDLIHL